MEAWVARILCADKEQKRREAKEGECDATVGVLGEAYGGGSDKDEGAGNDGSGDEDDGGEGGRPAKKARVAHKSKTNSNLALALLHIKWIT